MRKYIQGLLQLPRNVGLFLFVWFVASFCFAGVFTVLLNLYLLRLGHGPEFIGLTQGAAGLAFAVGAIPAGLLGVAVGLRKALLIGIAGIVTFTAILPGSLLLAGPAQKVVIVCSFGLYALFLTTLNVNGIAYLSASVPAERRSFVFSALVAIGPFAGFLGSLVGGSLPATLGRALGARAGDPIPYGLSLVLAPVLYGLALLVFSRSSPDAPHRRDDTTSRPPPSITPMVVMLVVVLLRNAVVFSLLIYLNAYWDTTYGTSTALIGAILSVGRLVAIPTAVLAPGLIARFGPRRVATAAGLIAPLMMGPVVLFTGVGPGIVSFVTVIALSSIYQAAFTTYHQEITSAEWRSVMSGAVYTATGTGFAAVAYLGGRVIAATGYRPFFLVSTLLTVAGVTLFSIYSALGERRSTQSQAASTGS